MTTYRIDIVCAMCPTRESASDPWDGPEETIAKAAEEKALAAGFVRFEIDHAPKNYREQWLCRACVEVVRAPEKGPPIYPKCHAVGPERCAPGCIDEEIRQAFPDWMTKKVAAKTPEDHAILEQLRRAPMEAPRP